MIPDLVSIWKSVRGHAFVLFDAKYYIARLEADKMPKGQPGIESVTKQYLYQLAFREFINDHGFSSVSNCFLMPTEEEEVVDKGEVRLAMLGGLELQNIQVRLLPASLAYTCYLSGRKLDVGELKL